MVRAIGVAAPQERVDQGVNRRGGDLRTRLRCFPTDLRCGRPRPPSILCRSQQRSPPLLNVSSGHVVERQAGGVLGREDTKRFQPSLVIVIFSACCPYLRRHYLLPPAPFLYPHAIFLTALWDAPSPPTPSLMSLAAYPAKPLRSAACTAPCSYLPSAPPRRRP